MMSQLVVAELGLTPGSDSGACAHRNRRRGDHRQKEQQGGHCPSPAQRQEGSEQGQGKEYLCSEASHDGQELQFSQTDPECILRGCLRARIFCI